MFVGQDEDNEFFETLSDFVSDMICSFLSDFTQGFIKESEYQRLLHLMLRNPHMKRGAGFGNMSVEDINGRRIKIEDDKLYIQYVYFKREDDSKLNSPYALFIKNSSKPVRYYNYYKTHDGFKFKQQRDLTEVMSKFGLSKEEAELYEKISREDED